MTNFIIKTRHWTKKSEKVDKKPTMLSKISLTTKKVKKFYEKIFYKKINLKKKSKLKAEKMTLKKEA